ncbi:MAG: PPC domain-containing DNA-binding protein [Bacteriovoracaceae bacterium]
MKKMFLPLLTLLTISCAHKEVPETPYHFHTIRLVPGSDLKKSLMNYVSTHRLKAVSIVTCVGSLTQYSLRLANQKESKTAKGHFEIVSLVGTMGDKSAHLHLAVSDEKGVTTGGHLTEDNLVYTTAEITLVEDLRHQFIRETDDTFGFQELKVIVR